MKRNKKNAIDVRKTMGQDSNVPLRAAKERPFAAVWWA